MTYPYYYYYSNEISTTSTNPYTISCDNAIAGTVTIGKGDK